MGSHSGAVWTRARTSISSDALALLESPFCTYALYGTLNRLDPLVKLYARGRKRGTSIVGDRAPYRQAVTVHGLGFRVLPALQLSLDGPDPRTRFLSSFLAWRSAS